MVELLEISCLIYPAEELHPCKIPSRSICRICNIAVVERLERRELLSTYSYHLITAFGGDISLPVSAVAVDSKSDLFGTALGGSASSSGLIYEIPSGSSTPQVIASFNTLGSVGAGGPTGNLVFDSAGNLYGTTQSGGTNGEGIIFELLAGTNSLVVLASFSSYMGYPTGNLSIDAAGNLYGATFHTGTPSQIYELPKGGTTI
jgi:uncharacterized repeat protein (TIGR03803 family)